MTDRLLLRAIRIQRRRDALEPKPKAVSLTKRQQEILQMIAEDMFATEIAAALYITRSTVEFHRQNLHRKLKCRTGAGMVYKAMRLGLLKAE